MSAETLEKPAPDEAKAPKAKAARTGKKGSTVDVSKQHTSVTERDIEAEVKTLIAGGFTEDEARSILG